MFKLVLATAHVAMVLLCSPAFADTYEEDNIHGYYNYGKGFNPYESPRTEFKNQYIRFPMPFAEEMSFDKLAEIIKTKKLTKIEDVIAELPDYMKEENYVLMYRSRSLQAATPSHPRAILFTPSASFMVAFNGGADQRGGNSLEMVQFRHDQKRFEFREISFDGVNVPKPSDANPGKCLTCHQSPNRVGADPRPNWEPYSTWIGTYAGNRSTFNPLNGILSAFVYQPQDAEVLEVQSHEREGYDDFRKNVLPGHPRYSQLKAFSVEAAAALSQHLTILDLMRVTRIVAEDKEIYPLYREIFAAMARCTKADPKDSKALQWMTSFEYPAYYDYTKYSDAVWGKLGATSNILTYLFEPIGIDTSDWSMDFGSGGRFAQFERLGTPTYTHGIFKYSWGEAAPDADELIAMGCENLYATGFKKLDAALESGQLEKIRKERLKPEATAQDILNRCVKCHVEFADVDAPPLPFDNPAKLALKLSKPFSKRGTFYEEIVYRTSDMAMQDEQMPKNRRLTASERQTLLSYLQELQ